MDALCLANKGIHAKCHRLCMLAYLSLRSSSPVLFDITSNVTSLPVEPFDLDYDINETERKFVESTG